MRHPTLFPLFVGLVSWLHAEIPSLGWNVPDPADLEETRERLAARIGETDLLDASYEVTVGNRVHTTRLKWNIPGRYAVLTMKGEGKNEVEGGMAMTWPDGHGELVMHMAMKGGDQVRAAWRMENVFENIGTLPGALAFMLRETGVVSDLRDFMDTQKWQPILDMGIRGNLVEIQLGFGATNADSRVSWLSSRVFDSIQETREDEKTLSLRLEMGEIFVICKESGLVVAFTGQVPEEDENEKMIPFKVKLLENRRVDSEPTLAEWATFLYDREYEELPRSVINNMMGHLVFSFLSFHADGYKFDPDPETVKSLNERIRAAARKDFHSIALAVVEPADLDWFHHRVLKPQHEAAMRGQPFLLWKNEKTFALEWLDPEKVPEQIRITPMGREFERSITQHFERAMSMLTPEVANPLRFLMRNHRESLLQGIHEAYFQAQLENVLERLSAQD